VLNYAITIIFRKVVPPGFTDSLCHVYVTGCTPQWNVFNNTNVLGGTQLPSTVNTLSACQQTCLGVPTCTAVDFNSLNSLCYWFTATSNGAKNPNQAYVTHYDLVNNCSGGKSSNIDCDRLSSRVSSDDSRKFGYENVRSVFNFSQSAFIKRHRTETTLLSIHDQIIKGLSHGKVICLMLLDLSATIDNIDHSIVLERFSYWFGISSTALSWIKSYYLTVLSMSKLNSKSSILQLCYGVPLGSVLGPLLFII